MAKERKYVNDTIGDQSNKDQVKFKRRRAIECTFVEVSISNPGYLKYLVTIQEKDGLVHTQPAYGKDMQGALKRLLNVELTKKVENKLTAGWFFVAWLVVMGWPAMMVEDQGQPWWLLYSFGGIFALIGLAAMWYQYIEKK